MVIILTLLFKPRFIKNTRSQVNIQYAAFYDYNHNYALITSFRPWVCLSGEYILHLRPKWSIYDRVTLFGTALPKGGIWYLNIGLIDLTAWTLVHAEYYKKTCSIIRGWKVVICIVRSNLTMNQVPINTVHFFCDHQRTPNIRSIHLALPLTSYRIKQSLTTTGSAQKDQTMLRSPIRMKQQTNQNRP